MEKFYNNGELCIVLKRVGTKAIILWADNTCTPYVVPLEHVKGASDWWQGRYFANLDDALARFNKEAEYCYNEKAAACGSNTDNGNR